MRVLIFEWMLGGGLWIDGHPLNSADSVWRQGLSMCRDIATDFLAAGCDVSVPVDARAAISGVPGTCLPIESGEALQLRLGELAAEADGLFLIAPESQGRLVRLLRWLEEFENKLLSPRLEWAELCGDKHRCLQVLAESGVQIPPGIEWRKGRDRWPPEMDLPAVVKPNDGCGGENLQIKRLRWGPEPGDGAWRVESVIPGEPQSVLVLAGPSGHVLLHPTVQRFAPGRLGDYLGGDLVRDAESARIAAETAQQAVSALSGMTGMFGLDLIVDRAEGIGTVVEVNPRLTSSYCGLRQAYHQNLASCLLDLQRGVAAPAPAIESAQSGLSWRVES